MDVEFDSKKLRSLYTDLSATEGFSEALVKRFRFVLGLIVNAADERDFSVLPGLRFEKLKGKRSHQYSFRLNDQWRLIIELRGKAPRKIVGVVEIADYHK